MQKKQGAELFPLDTEFERTLRGLKKVKSAEIVEMADERLTRAGNQEFAAEVPQERDTMEDFWRPVIPNEYLAVRQPAIDAKNFELKLALITMVQQNQFTGHPTEDPNEHLGWFLRMANTVKLNGVRPEVIKMQLFPFSLRDITATWFDSLPYGSVNTWEELMEAYLGRFFPPSLTSKRRGEITTFKQGEDESLYTAWERYKRLLKRCPMHGIDLNTQMDIFYHSMNYTSKGIIDAACGGAFRRRSAEEARQLIEDLSRCNMGPPSESSGSSSRAKGNGMIELNKMSAIEAKLDALMHQVDKRMHSANEIGAVEREGRVNNVEERAAEGSYAVEEANYLNEQRAYHFKPNLNLPTHYTPALRNHENFSYGGGAQQVPRHGQNFQQGYAPLRFQQQQQGEGINEYQGHKRAQTFEDQMLQFMGENKKLLNFHEQKFAELEASNTNSQIFKTTTNASLKNLETQIWKLAPTLQNQIKDAFPSDTKKNPKDCMAVQLRSGKELEKEKLEKEEGDKGEGSLENAELLKKERKKEQQQEEERSKKKAQNSMPAVPFSQRLQKSKIEEQFARFFKTFEKLEISMPFTKVVTQIPFYAKFMKEILSKKRRTTEE